MTRPSRSVATTASPILASVSPSSVRLARHDAVTHVISIAIRVKESIRTARWMSGSPRENPVGRKGYSRATAAADAQAQPRADARIECDAHGDRIPERARGGVDYAALDHAAQDESGIAGRTAPGVVGTIGDHDRPAIEGQGLVERGVDAR